VILRADTWGAGAPLVLLHGFTGSAATWEPVRALLGARRRVVAVELPGHGASPAPAPSCRLPEVARAAVAAVARLGILRADWLGYSLGGRLALQVAADHPDAVTRLVLESASPGIADDAARAARAAADDALAARLAQDGLAWFVDHWMAQLLFASQRRLDPVVLARERRVRLAQSAGGLATALRALSVGRQAPLWGRLATVATPTVVVAGADDERYVAIGRAMAARLPAARVAVVPDAGHTVHLENPVPFWSLVCRFLDAAPQTSLEGAFA
jgi:2-succinyl-6-hydroxy-2,4-cyclohexadiene-1-carboxylate synthase